MYRPYQQFPQPVITNVKTTVDLYPNENNYAVQGQYTLVNKTGVSIDSLLVYIDRRAKLNSVEIPNAEMVKEDLVHRHYWYSLSKPLQPGDSTTMQFQFSSSWSPFNGHTPFNSIIDNGSFMRISRYYPLLGYQPDNEIGNQEERTKRGMPTPTEVPKLESKDTSTYDFIHLDAVVSTSSDQTAVGVGELVGSWSKDERNYFHYKTPIPIEFRFAFSSAKYAVKKEQHKGIQIEVYYHPQHSENVNQLIANAKNTLAYCEDNFGPYPFKVIRFAEVSGFVEGFNATAYPATIFMLENLAFHSDLTKGNDQDVINELAGHELSHQWWGTSQLAPDEREGSRVLVETLAMYTELMLYQKAHGLERAVGTVAMHRGFYLSARSFSKEVPLYKANPDQIHLFYNKGTVIMHQLRWLIGEDSVNKALNSLLLKHAYPKKMPTTIDLMNAFYAVSKVEAHAAIDEMFKQIITHDAKVENVTSIKIKDDRYELTFEASIRKYSEDGNGNKTEVTPDPTIEVALYTEDGAEKIVEYPVSGKRLKEVLTLDKKPVRIVIDPHLRLLDTFSDDNEKDIEDDFDQRK